MATLREIGGTWLLFTPTPESIPVLTYASEWGAERIIPVRTSAVAGEMLDLREAAEALATSARRSGRSASPDLAPWTSLLAALQEVGVTDRILLVLDELCIGPCLATACRDLPATRTALLVGPRLGFDPVDRKALLETELPLRRVTLGPRLMSPEAAACAAVAVVQQLAGFCVRD